MHVTFVMMCKGRLAHLKKSLPAVLRQQEPRFRVTLVDYACPDGAGNWAESLGDKRVSVVRVKPGTDRYSAAHAHNIGAADSDADIIAFVDADVVLKPRWLAQVIERFERNPAAVICRNWGPLRSEGYRESQWGLCAVRAEVFREAGAYDEAIERWGGEDTDLYHRVQKLGSVIHYDNALVHCIQHPSEDSTRFHPESDKDLCEQFVKRYLSMRRGPVNPFGWGRELPETRGVVTAAHQGYFPGLKLLVESIYTIEAWPVTCIDLGLTETQRTWCREQGVCVIPLSKLNVPAELQDAFNGTDAVRERFDGVVKYLWLKPWYVAASPYTLTAWIDADAVVLRPLSELFVLSRGGPVVMPDMFNSASTPNRRRLYELLPVPNIDRDSGLNSGVVVLRRGRDDAVMDGWKHCTLEAARQPAVRDAIAFHDQGALLWAMHKTGQMHRIAQDATWNTPGRRQLGGACGCATPRMDDDRLFDRLRSEHPGVGIAHWMAVPKLWQLLKHGPQKAMIVFRPRSGSHMLESQLEAHPQVRWFGELLNPWVYPEVLGVKPWREAAVVHERVWKHAGNASVVGFRWDLPQACREHLVSDKNVKVILLQRRNALAREVSWMQAQLSREWSITKRAEPPVEITARVRPQWLLRRFEEHDSYHDKVRGIFAQHPILEVSYEELCRSPEEWAKVAAFLNVEPTPWGPRTLKQERRMMQEVLQNFDELAAFFEGTKYAWMFTDEPAAVGAGYSESA